MIKKIMVLIAVVTFIVYGIYENIQIEKKFNLKKTKALTAVNAEIAKRERLNYSMEKLANDFSIEYENNINENLLILRDKIKKATNEKELLYIINN